MQFTAAAIMRLVDRGDLSLDTHVSDVIPGINGGDRITIRNLLEERSGLSDINARADYNSILAQHQTPASLVSFISRDSLLFDPGSKYVREEHSAYNLLALIIERKTGKPFRDAMREIVFAPVGMSSAGADDDSPSTLHDNARGYAPDGVYGIMPATPIHWSGKTGNASIYLSARDQAKWTAALFHGSILSAASRAAILDTIPRVGYGWFRGTSARFGEVAYYMNGRSPGFSSFVTYFPKTDLTVIALSNIYSSATTDIGNDIAAIVLGREYKLFAAPVDRIDAKTLGLEGTRFTFGKDFYQPNATLSFVAKSTELFLGWPGGSLTPMIPLDRDHYIDRAYWATVVVERDSTGAPVALMYDRFKGERVTQ
jgi:CubicO group peptidase (beta-lactamase class C family)